jgi:hypothetical protein
MNRLAKLSALVVGSLLVASLAAVAWFDIAFVRPMASKARALLAQASTAEREPPLDLVRLLAASDGGKERRSVLVRRLLYLDPPQVNGLRTTQRQLVELGATALIGWRLNEHEITSTRLVSAYLGAGVVGFEHAAAARFNVPLERLSRDQLAELVALERAPTADAERIKRIKQHLLSRSA